MKKFLLGSAAAVALALCLLPQEASAYWAYRTRYRWDPHCGRYVAYTDRYWVPDCDDHHHHGHRDRSYYPGYDRDYGRNFPDRSGRPYSPGSFPYVR